MAMRHGRGSCAGRDAGYGSIATPADARDRYFAEVQEDQPGRAGSNSPSRRICPRISTEERAVKFRHKIIPDLQLVRWFTHSRNRGVTMGRGRLDDNRLMDVVQINGKKARDCTPRECELIGEFYYKLTELQTIAEKLRCARPLDLPRLVTLAYRAAEQTKRIGGKNPLLSEIIYH